MCSRSALFHLDLGYNHIGAAGARIIAEALAHAGAESLGGVLAQCPALAHLDLSSNDIGTAGAESLAGVLAQCRALAYLKLAWNWIGNEGAERLAEVLGQCPALVHLDLEFNEIEAAGAEGREQSLRAKLPRARAVCLGQRLWSCLFHKKKKTSTNQTKVDLTQV